LSDGVQHAAREADFRTFYSDVFGPLAAFAYRQVSDAALADELTQEAMTRVYARWSLLREPRAYAYRVVGNLVRDHVRAARREREAWRSLAGPEAYEPLTDRTLLEAVDALPDRLRTVVLLHYFADLPLREVARTIRRPLGTVTRQIAEARRLLLEMPALHATREMS
jgi:RNA polymerase sigma-70 factor (ECF subfamily)